MGTFTADDAILRVLKLSILVTDKIVDDWDTKERIQ